MEVGDVQAGPVRLSVAVAGDPAAPPILLVHGFHGAKEDFTPSLDRFGAAGFRAVAPDVRGHGASDHPAGEDSYRLEQLAADMWALVDVLGWERFGLLGWSMGGMVAQLMALRAPERVAALVLQSAAHGSLALLPGFDAEQAAVAANLVRRHGTGWYADVVAQQRRRGEVEPEAARRLLRERPEWAAFEDRKLRAASADMLAALFDEFFVVPDRLDELRSLAVPTLVVCGEQDEQFLGSCERITAAVRGARLVVIAGAGHAPHHEAPEEWARTVIGFFSEQRAQWEPR